MLSGILDGSDTNVNSVHILALIDECNSHIKRRHAEKLVTSSAPLSTFIIDLNKEASQVRNKKKQSTLRKKNTMEKKAGKNKGKATGKEGI